MVTSWDEARWAVEAITGALTYGRHGLSFRHFFQVERGRQTPEQVTDEDIAAAAADSRAMHEAYVAKLAAVAALSEAEVASSMAALADEVFAADPSDDRAAPRVRTAEEQARIEANAAFADQVAAEREMAARYEDFWG